MRTTFAALPLAAAAVHAVVFEAGASNSQPASSSLSAQSEPISDLYIIKFKNHIDDSSASEHHTWITEVQNGGEQKRLELRKRSELSTSTDVYTGMKHTFKIGEAFRGYAGHFHPSTIDEIRNHPDVEFVEEDRTVHVMQPVESKPATEDFCDGETEKSAPWGLARISHRDSLHFGTFKKYLFAKEGGEGVDAYVIDTGCNVDHVDFDGRVKWGKTIPLGDADEDGNGHGTHCSGTIAGTKYGVAKKANVYALKVLRSNGSGSMSDVVKGVEFAVNSHLEQAKAAKDGKRKGFKGSVANMSLGGGKTSALDAAVNAAVDAGIHFAVAAGNDNSDACKYSPAAASNPLTVGASALDDSRAYFSNYGKCTDIFAPGLNILSTWIGSKSAVNVISGTSMASPHICGLLAYYLSLQPAVDSEFAVTPLSPKKLKDDIISIATKGALSDIPEDTPNKLAWNGGGCSNFTKIIDAGSYTSKAHAATSNKVPKGAQKLGSETEKLAKLVSGKVEKLAKDVEEYVLEEVKELLEEL